MSVRLLRREVQIEEIKPVPGEERTYEFVIATERPVHVGYPVPEVLRMAGADLSRFSAPPVLNTHNTNDIRNILGVGFPRIEGRRMVARIKLDPTPEGEAARLRIESGSLRSASIGYTVDPGATVRLGRGDTDGFGDGAVMGPALIRNRWSPYEITLCPVGADEAAVRLRSFRQEAPMEFSEIMAERQAPNAASQPGAPANPTPRQQAAVIQFPDEVERETRRSAARMVERRETDTAIRSLVSGSPHLRAVAEDCVIEGLSLEAARAKILAEKAKIQQPGGTPEPVEAPNQRAAERAEAPMPEDLTDDVLVRSFQSLS